MNILFVMQSPEYLRYYDSTLIELAARGHAVSIAVNKLNERKRARLESVTEASDRIRFAGVVPARGDVWQPVARAIRGTIDFVRFLHPRFAEAPQLRARMVRKALPPVLRFLGRLRTLGRSQVRPLVSALTALERAIPGARAIGEFIDAELPDVVLVSPLVDAASPQVDVVKCARERGIPCGACIASWDNLTNKGLLRLVPDAVFVWNETQRAEAVEFHSVPSDRVVVTGAQLFDRWFERRPSRTREELCRAVGLPAAKPIVLFAGSTAFISSPRAEVEFVRRWIGAVRASGDPALRDAGILVRPHPYNHLQWEEERLEGMGDAVVWPRHGSNPVDESDRSDYYDSLHHSAAVVGINTSAMIEAAIVGRPVFTILASEFLNTQEGTLHFRYLAPENGGFLRVASSLEENVRQLAETLRQGGAVEERTLRFVESFIRPRGLDVPSTPILVTGIERLGGAGTRRRSGVPLWLRPASAVLWLAGLAVLAKARFPSRKARELARKKAEKAAKKSAAEKKAKDAGVPGEIGAAARRETRAFENVMKIIFLAQRHGHFRNFDSVLRLLARRGHAIRIAVDQIDGEGEAPVRKLCEEFPAITYGPTPSRGGMWDDLARGLRLSQDCLRYMDPSYKDAPRLRARAEERTWRLFRAFVRLPGIRSRPGLSVMRTVLRLLERALPRSHDVDEFFKVERPDVVMVTPLLDLGSLQVDYLRSAAALGLRSVFCVWSWDHLSSKSLLRDLPDVITVWNETQKREAVELHGVPPERIAVTGAQAFDHWFEWRPRPREDFCRRAGLDPSKPFLLYVCSSLFPGGIPETRFIERWIEALRSSEDARLREVQILIRPHPKRLG
ncbi:MAG TPA: hypothetical protein VMT52_19465, partial [Planctomycetota bacterium]|nr:hypothetical protein [Planctomycetota bacterium]